jgi:predicted ATPase
MMAYEIFAGKYPFNARTITMLMHSIINEKPDVSILSPGLAPVIERLTTKNADDRYQTADAALEALYQGINQPPPQESADLRDSLLQAAKFVGREAELGLLLNALDQAVTGKGSAWLVGGESGVGKSRLLDELRIRALVAGAMVVRGQAVAEGGLPGQLWRDPLRRLVLAAEPGDLAAGIIKPLIPDISTLLQRPIDDAPDLPGPAGQQRLALTIVDICKAQTMPLVLLLEDLQWMGESQLALRQLNQLVPDLPLLLIGTYRHDEAPDLPNELPGMQVLKLNRLSDTEIGELSVSMLGETGKQTEVLDFLRRETEGNTFFMVEVVRTLAEEAGRLRDIASKPLPHHMLAGGIQSIMRRRLNRVPDVLQRQLKLAAVAGRELDLAVLGAIALAGAIAPDAANDGSSGWLDQFLMTCANSSVLEIVEEKWRFCHDKLREVLLSDLTEAERPALHRQIASAIELVYPGDSAYADALVEHWYSAGVVDKTLHYTLIAAERLIEYAADTITALRLLERGIALLDLEPDVEHDSRRARLLRLMGKAYERQSKYPMAENYFRESLRLVQDDSLTSIQALDGLSWVAILQAKYPEAREYATQELSLAKAENYPRGIADSRRRLGSVARSQGDYAAATAHFEQSLAISQGIGDRRSTAMTLNSLGIVALNSGDPAASIGYYEQCLAINREIGDRQGIATSLNNLGVAAQRVNDYPGSRAYFEESLGINRQIGDRRGIANCLNNLGEVTLLLDDHSAARDYLMEGLALARDIRLIPMVIDCLIQSAQLRLFDGDGQQAALWLGVIIEHPAALADTLKNIAAPLQAKLEPVLGAETLTELMEQGKKLDLDTVVQQILAEYGAQQT